MTPKLRETAKRKQSANSQDNLLLPGKRPKVSNIISKRKCTFCNKEGILTISELEAHEKNCEISVNLRKSQKNIVSKKDKPNLVCGVCSRTFKYLSRLITHEKQHKSQVDTQPEPEQNIVYCKYCEFHCNSDIQLEQHKEASHKEFLCQLCKVTFDTSEKYNDHIQNIHNGKYSEGKICENCGRQFKNNEHLRYHKKTNCGTIFPFECKECKKCFRSKGILKTHSLIHSGEKKFTCSFCPKQFTVKAQVVVHERRHTGEKPYKCEICSKTFAHRESLVTHSSTHTGLKPYLCECCSARFSCVSSILAHRRTRPDTCGLPQYCTKLSKACPRPSARVTPASNKITNHKVHKVLKITEKEKLRKKRSVKKQGNINDSGAAKRLTRNQSKLNLEDNGQDNTKNFLSVKIKTGRLVGNKVVLSDPEELNVLKDAELIEKESITMNMNINPNISKNEKNNTSKCNLKNTTSKLKYEIENSQNGLCAAEENSFCETLSVKSEFFDNDDTNESFNEIDDIGSFEFLDVTKVVAAIAEKSDAIPKKLPEPLESSEVASKDESENEKDEEITKLKVQIFECIECIDRKQFKRKISYEQHLRKSHNKSESDINEILKLKNYTASSYSCKVCGKSYSYQKALQEHLKVHGIDGKLVKQCRTCSLYFANKEELKKHAEKKHKNEITCNLCHKIYKHIGALKSHKKYAHSELKKTVKCKKYTFICNKCGKKLSSKTTFIGHELSNCGKNPIYKCTECEKALSTQAALRTHMLIHSGELPFKCPFCEKGFRTKAPMVVHQRMHTGEKPFQCTYCEKAFAYRENLFIHLSTHTGIKRYLCITCSERFSCISGLKNHWRTYADTCGSDPNRTTKATGKFLGYRKGQLVHAKIPD